MSSLDRPPNSFLRLLPKAELHLHLEGAIEPATLFELRQRHGERVTPAEVDSLHRYEDFQGFLLAFKHITEHLRTAAAYAWPADHGLRLTAHAGETGPPESVWGALNLRGERIGHGLTAFHDADLVEELAQRQVPVEICLTSNLRTGLCPNLNDHPAKTYFDQGVMITLNSDDPAMFGTTLAREYQIAQQFFGFTYQHFPELPPNPFKPPFL